MRLRGVLLDLDDTLLDHRGAVGRALELWLPELGVTPTREHLTLWNEVQEPHLKAWRKRRIDFDEQRRRRLRDFLPAIQIAYAESELDVIFGGYLRAYESSYRSFPDVPEMLSTIAAAGLVTAVLTNGNRGQQHRKLERVGLAGRVGPVYTPDDLGVAKPAPEAFRLACSRWGLAPNEVVSVGDNHEFDVLGARAAGLRAIHLDRRDEGPFDEEHRIGSLAALRVGV
jgi:putative hydrolase of the HAD superfamily